MTVTTFSDRYYADEIGQVSWDGATGAIRSLNDIKFKMYDALYAHEFKFGDDPLKEQSLYHYARSLGLNSLYANVMEPFVKGIIRSQKSNHADYAADVRNGIKEVADKLEATERSLSKKRSVNYSALKYRA